MTQSRQSQYRYLIRLIIIIFLAVFVALKNRCEVTYAKLFSESLK